MINSAEAKKYFFKGLLKIKSFQSYPFTYYQRTKWEAFSPWSEMVSALLSDEEAWTGRSLSESGVGCCPYIRLMFGITGSLMRNSKAWVFFFTHFKTSNMFVLACFYLHSAQANDMSILKCENKTLASQHPLDFYSMCIWVEFWWDRQAEATGIEYKVIPYMTG